MEPRNDMRAEQAATWAIRLDEGELAASDHAMLQAWLDADRRNGEMLEEIAGSWVALDGYATAVPIMAMREEALASARRQSRRIARPSFGRNHWWAAIAATLLFAFIGGGFWYSNQPDIYETGRGERRVVMLDDGSKLSLDASTLLRVKYSGERRQFWLDRGRAKFDVAKDPFRPFQVTASDKTVVATGTAFSVELIDKEFRVVLYEGHIVVLKHARDGKPSVIVDRHAREGKDSLINPGQELVIAAPAGSEGQTARIAAIDPVRTTAWESGMLVFEDEPLSTVIARTNRSSARQLELGDARVGNLRISGVFRAGDNDGLVEGLQAMLGVRAVPAGQSTRIYAEGKKP